jgi:hypothetical protein
LKISDKKTVAKDQVPQVEERNKRIKKKKASGSE